MGKFHPTIVLYSDSDNSSDSLQLINPVTHLSLEHLEKNQSIKDFDESLLLLLFDLGCSMKCFSQSNQLAKLDLNDSNYLIEKSRRKRNETRPHPYSKPSLKTKEVSFKQKKKNKKDQCDMNFLKSLGYLQYSSKKISSKHLQMSQSISKSVEFVCNRRAN